jgi:A/G-specific adenine glycosylase
MRSLMSAVSDLRPSLLNDSARPALRRALLRWYDHNRRDLPWRRSRDPYHIWLSEIMLQQTRVAAVLEHYRLFLESFPDIRTLAAASESAVLAAWSGLGYYRRARMLRCCAQKIVDEHCGRFPQTSEDLLTLPGIGRYTAAAIASIAFAEPVAVVDGNVERVLQRLAGRTLPAKEMWQRAQSTLSKSRPADFNQAMMELGAVVCTPRQPKCGACPLRKWCVTRGESPRLISSKRQAKKEIWYSLDQRGAHIRLVQRPKDSSLMASMWELPQLKSRLTASKEGKKEGKNDEPPMGQKEKNEAPWRTFRHSITVTDYTVHVARTGLNRSQGRWIAVNEIPKLPITGLTRKILKAAGII